jgi:hypothetical protein
MWGLVFYSSVENTCNDRIISLRGVIWAHTTSLSPPLFIEVPVPSPVSERSCIYVLGASIMTVSTDFFFLLDVGTIQTIWYVLFSFHYSKRLFITLSAHCIINSLAGSVHIDGTVIVHQMSLSSSPTFRARSCSNRCFRR